MNAPFENVSMALFCDFENVALGVRDAKYERFDIKLVLERLLLKGSIVVKKAYCDWERYKGFKTVMHEANFELIDIPHVRQSGKNSADIRLVVDALDLCYTKSHVNTFVIISGDSDFSPLVSKLRENAKQVIGLGVKQSTSDLLIANCDEFIFYDDLVRETHHQAARREPREAGARRAREDDKPRKDDLEARRDKGITLAVETFDALMAERGDSGKIWASVLKEAIKRRRPDFNESYYGFRAFGNLLEAAQARGLLEFGRDEKSGAYVYRGADHGGGVLAAGPAHHAPEPAPVATPPAVPAAPAEHAPAPQKPAAERSAAGRSAAKRPATERSATGNLATEKPTAQTAVPPTHAETEPARSANAAPRARKTRASRPARQTAAAEPTQPGATASIESPAADTAGKPGDLPSGKPPGRLSAKPTDQSTSKSDRSDQSDKSGQPAESQDEPAGKSAAKTARKTPARRRTRTPAAPAESD